METEKERLIYSLEEYIYWYGVRDSNDNLVSNEQQEETIRLAIELLNKLKN